MPNEKLTVTSSVFEHNGYIPVEYTGYGADKSPPLTLSGLVPEAKTLAVIMVDLDIPFIREYPHWVIWNLPVMDKITEAIPKGKSLPKLNGARQGLAYGKYTYAGPKIPKFLRNRHRYVFTVYALDTALDISSDSNRRVLLKAMQGHILQQGSIMGLYRNKYK